MRHYLDQVSLFFVSVLPYLIYLCAQHLSRPTLPRQEYSRERPPFLISLGIHALRPATRRRSASSHLSASRLSSCSTPQMGG
jgi:hypothetical protein